MGSATRTRTATTSSVSHRTSMVGQLVNNPSPILKEMSFVRLCIINNRPLIIHCRIYEQKAMGAHNVTIVLLISVPKGQLCAAGGTF